MISYEVMNAARLKALADEIETPTASLTLGLEFDQTIFYSGAPETWVAFLRGRPPGLQIPRHIACGQSGDAACMALVMYGADDQMLSGDESCYRAAAAALGLDEVTARQIFWYGLPEGREFGADYSDCPAITRGEMAAAIRRLM